MTSRPSSIAQTVTGVAAGMALLYFLRGILIPLVLAIVLAILVDAVVRMIATRAPRAPRWGVVLLTTIVVIGSVAASFYIIAQGAARIVADGPDLIKRLDETVQVLGQSLHLERRVNLATLTGDVDVPHVAGSVLGNLQSLTSALLLIIPYFGFILAGRSRIARHFYSLSNWSDNGKSVKAALDHIAEDVETYVWVQTVTGVMIAGAAAAVMFAVGLSNAWFWTIMLFLLCFIPMIGVTVGSIIPALFALLQFPTWWQAAVIFGAIQVVAFVVGNLIYPRLQAETQNINPIATLLALSFWGFLWGLTGAFLAVPLTLIAMMACSYFEQTRWIAVLLSDDGKPSFPREPAVTRQRSKRARAARPAERDAKSSLN